MLNYIQNMILEINLEVKTPNCALNSEDNCKIGV